ncbi:hypothetical protein, partial [Acinetobacter sp. YH16055]|uniref:hypothetical protein n=1 Tax=Acinetobacter sp. YH16055 TaxID=2601193 RepID=UPI0015D38767
MKKILIIGLASLFAIGCATTSGLNPQTAVSNFDGVKSVAIAPHGAACKSMVCPMVGASWLDNHPDNVGITIQLFNEIANIHSVSFNIDGEIINIKNDHATSFDQAVGANYSQATMVVSYSILTKILQSKRTWMRVSTSKGAHEVAIVDGAVDS